VDLENPTTWERMEVNESKVYPGPLSRHTSVVIGDELLIFGGQVSINKSSNKLYKYHFITKTFTES
jgi:hypothetical protein